MLKRLIEFLEEAEEGFQQTKKELKEEAIEFLDRLKEELQNDDEDEEL
jgi:hypothetical protein